MESYNTVGLQMCRASRTHFIPSTHLNQKKGAVVKEAFNSVTSALILYSICMIHFALAFVTIILVFIVLIIS